MKRKFLSILFALVLLCSLGLVTAVPAAAEGQPTQFTLDKEGTSTATWVTDPAPHAGNYSVKLDYDDIEKEGSYVEFVPALGTLMTDLDDFVASFWALGEPECPAIELRFTSPTFDPNSAGAGTATWGHVDITLRPGVPSATWAEASLDHTLVIGNCFFNDPVNGTAGHVTMPPVEQLGEVLAMVNASTVMTDHGSIADTWELTRVRLELAWRGAPAISYVDDVTIEGVTYDLEFSLTGVEADPSSFNPAVAPTTIRATASPGSTLYFRIYNPPMSVLIKDDVALTETDPSVSGVYEGTWDGKNQMGVVMPEGTYVVAVREACQTLYTYGCPVKIDTTPPVMVSAVTRYEFQLAPAQIGSTYIDVTFNEDIATATAGDFTVTNPDCNIVGDPTIADSVVTLRVSLAEGGGLKGHETPTVTIVPGGGTVTDIAGNEAEAQYVVADDEIVPTISDICEDDCIAAGKEQTTITGITEPFAEVTVTITDGTTTATGTGDADANGDFEVTVDVSGLDDVDLTKTIVAEDAAGNVSATWSPSVEPCKDTVLPVVVIETLNAEGPPPPAITGDDTPTFAGTATDDNPCCTNLDVDYNIDGTGWQNVTEAPSPVNWSFTTSSLSSGPHTVVVRATDCCGNIGYASLEFVVDLVPGPPVILDAVTGWNWRFSGTCPEDMLVGEGGPTIYWCCHAGIGYAYFVNDRSSIMVVFSEPLDPTTVQRTDFTVTGNVVSSIEFYNGRCNHAHTWVDLEYGELSTNDFGLVFLTVSPLMATDATPTVKLVGTVSDWAGFPSELDSKEAQDGIAPVITLSSNPVEPVYNQLVTITATSTEELSEAHCGLPKWADGDIVRDDKGNVVYDMYEMSLGAAGNVWTTEELLWPYPPMAKIHVKVWAHDETDWVECKWWKNPRWAEESLIFGGGDYVGIHLCEGWNLISVPGNLVNPSLGDVFHDGSVTKVYHWTGYGWQYAMFNPISGTWYGTITSIVPGKGYWVWCSPSDYHLGLRLLLPDPMSPPPSYSLQKGWNLIGFTAIDYPLKYRSMSDYLFSLCDICKLVYWYDAHSQQWFRVTPTADWWPSCKDRAKPGYGYWLFLAEPGVLAP